MRVLVDTNVFAGLANQQDSLHEQAHNIGKSIEDPITTDYVFDELTNVLMRRKDKDTAIAFCSALIERVHIERVEPDDFEEAWELFKQHKKLSFTDCTNIAVMKNRGIKQIATFDEHFKGIDVIEVLGYY